jgi:hypothetical protein
MPRILRLLLSLLLAAAAGGCAATPAAWLHTYGLSAEPRPGDMSVCTAYACLDTARTALGPEEWSRVRDLFDPPPSDPAAERAAAARAIGLMEELVGSKVGTADDQPQDMTAGDDAGQLDCIAEAANTTVYLLLLAQDGLLPRHRVAAPAHRGFLVFFPHNTAVLEEVDGGEAFAVDSWYGANGETAKVWTLAAWKAWDTDGDAPGVLLAWQGRKQGPMEKREP